MQGSGYRTPPALARRADGQTVQLTPLLYATLSALDGRRTYAEVAAAVARRRASRSRRTTRASWSRSCGRRAWWPPRTARRRSCRAATRCSGCGSRWRSPTRRRRAGSPTPFAALFHPVVVVPAAGRLRLDHLVGALRQGARLGHARGVRASRPAARGPRHHRPVGRLPRVRPCRGRPTRRSDPGCDGGRALPRVAGVLHRRHRLLPPRSRGTAAHRPRRPLLQRDRRRGHRRRLVGDALRRASCCWWRRRSCRCCASCCRSSGSTATTCWPTSPACPTSSQRIGPVLRSLVPWRPAHPDARALKPWARVVVTAWVLTVVPVLLGVTVLMVLTLPRDRRHGLGRRRRAAGPDGRGVGRRRPHQRRGPRARHGRRGAADRRVRLRAGPAGPAGRRRRAATYGREAPAAWPGRASRRWRSSPASCSRGGRRRSATARSRPTSAGPWAACCPSPRRRDASASATRVPAR